MGHGRASRYPDFDWSTPDSGRESVVIGKLNPHTWPSVDLDQRVVAGKNSASHHSAAFRDLEAEALGPEIVFGNQVAKRDTGDGLHDHVASLSRLDSFVRPDGHKRWTGKQS